MSILSLLPAEKNEDFDEEAEMHRAIPRILAEHQYKLSVVQSILQQNEPTKRSFSDYEADVPKEMGRRYRLKRDPEENTKRKKPSSEEPSLWARGFN